MVSCSSFSPRDVYASLTRLLIGEDEKLLKDEILNIMIAGRDTVSGYSVCFPAENDPICHSADRIDSDIRRLHAIAAPSRP